MTLTLGGWFHTRPPAVLPPGWHTAVFPLKGATFPLPKLPPGTIFDATTTTFLRIEAALSTYPHTPVLLSPYRMRHIPKRLQQRTRYISLNPRERTALPRAMRHLLHTPLLDPNPKTAGYVLPTHLPTLQLDWLPFLERLHTLERWQPLLLLMRPQERLTPHEHVLEVLQAVLWVGAACSELGLRTGVLQAQNTQPVPHRGTPLS